MYICVIRVFQNTKMYCFSIIAVHVQPFVVCSTFILRIQKERFWFFLGDNLPFAETLPKWNWYNVRKEISCCWVLWWNSRYHSFLVGIFLVETRKKYIHVFMKTRKFQWVGLPSVSECDETGLGCLTIIF